jgi:hypothetical protein
VGKQSRRENRRNRKLKQAAVHTIHRENRTIVIKCRGTTVGAQDFPGDLENFFNGGKKWIKETLDAHREVCEEK